MRISDWSSDVCSSDLVKLAGVEDPCHPLVHQDDQVRACDHGGRGEELVHRRYRAAPDTGVLQKAVGPADVVRSRLDREMVDRHEVVETERRSEEHTSELQSLMRISYAVFCLKKKK